MGPQPGVILDGWQKSRRMCGTGYMKWLRKAEIQRRQFILRHAMWVKPQFPEPMADENDDNYLLPMQSVSVKGKV